MNNAVIRPIREWHDRDATAERPTFEDAQRIVRELLADADMSEIQPRGNNIGRSWTAIRRDFGEHRAEEALRNWIPASERDIDYWDALHVLAAELLRNGERLPDALANWLAEVLEGKRRRPKQKPGRRWYANGARDSWTGYAIGILWTLGIRPTRNQASPAQSGCDVLANHLNLSYEAVASIWAKQRTASGRLPAPWECWNEYEHG